MGQKIDGSGLAEQHKQKLIQKLSEIRQGNRRAPKLVSFCNINDPASVRYTKMKQRMAEEVGVEFIFEEYSMSSEAIDLANKVREYNDSDLVDGIMIQLPLPLDLVVFRDDLLDLINPEKDVDGLTVRGQEIYQPATVKSVISILDSEVPDWKTQQIGVVGADGEVGVPLIRFMINNLRLQGVVLIDRTRGNLDTDLQNCDVIISCVGKEALIKPEMIKQDLVLIDVGLGDFAPECFAKSVKYTGKYGGVGPMTVVSLMENVVDAYSSYA